MKRRKWRRSMKLDEIWTTSILHAAGWLVRDAWRDALTLFEGAPDSTSCKAEQNDGEAAELFRP